MASCIILKYMKTIDPDLDSLLPGTKGFQIPEQTK